MSGSKRSRWYEAKIANSVLDTLIFNYLFSMLDFVFVANGAKEFEADCKVVVRENDFPDTDQTSDHRATRVEIRF